MSPLRHYISPHSPQLNFYYSHLCELLSDRTKPECLVTFQHLDVLEDVGVGQGEGRDVFGLPQVSVQPVGEVHHVVLGGVDLPQGGGQRAAPLLQTGLLAAPLLLQLQPLGLHAELGALGALVRILRPQRLCLLPQELENTEFELYVQITSLTLPSQTSGYLYLLEARV